MIDELKNRFPIAWRCMRLDLARNGYYRWSQRQSNSGPRATQDGQIASEIKEDFHAHRRHGGGQHYA